MHLMTLPSNLEQRLLALKTLLEQFSPSELEQWLEFVYAERSAYPLQVQQYFITFVLAYSQRLYRTSHDSYYERYHDSSSI